MQQNSRMKKSLVLLAAVFITVFASAQMSNPVTWTFSSKKISDKVYEMQITATIEQGWHLYSQSQPKDAIAQPTSFKFNSNPLLQLDGKINENGKLEKYKDETLDISANQYSNKVTFVQKVKLKTAKAKTALTGKLEFQTCDDKKCLPPKTVNFSINI